MNLTERQRLHSAATTMHSSNTSRWTERRPRRRSFSIVPTRPTRSITSGPSVRTMVNEALATVSLDDVYIPVDTAHFFDRTTAGINYPYIFPTGKLIQNRIPTANITGLNGLTGNPYPSHSTGPIYTFTDSLTWIKGQPHLEVRHSTSSVRVRMITTKSTSAPARPAPTIRTASSRSPIPAPVSPLSGNAIANTALGHLRQLLRTRPARLHDFPRQQHMSLMRRTPGR